MASGPSYPHKIGKKKKKKTPSLQLYVLLIFEIIKYSNWDSPSSKPFLEIKKKKLDTKSADYPINWKAL
jgi:hypothetical protein